MVKGETCKTPVRTQGAVTIDPEAVEEKAALSWAAGVSEAGQHSAVQPRRNECISRARQIHMTGIKQHNQIVCATI